MAILTLLALAAACGGQPPQPTLAPAPRPAAPFPSPGITAQPSPSPAARPSATATATATPIPLAEYPFAVMVDNIAEARPQVGLDKADVVYEAPAEAGIPRLMPVYFRSGVDVERIGPVRSARHYFIYLANEFRAALVHIGASPQGFVAFGETGLPDVDEIRGSNAFVRDRRRLAPHNAFVNSEGVRAELKDRGVQLDASTTGLRLGAAQPGPEPATSARLAYSGAEHYVVEYAYDAASRMYLRSMDGQPHRDGASGEQYAARSIVVQYVNVTPIPGDEALRVDVQLVGSGKGLLLVDGTQVPLTWSKNSIRTPTLFRRGDGAPFLLPEGQVWIQLVPTDSQVDVS